MNKSLFPLLLASALSAASFALPAAADDSPAAKPAAANKMPARPAAKQRPHHYHCNCPEGKYGMGPGMSGRSGGHGMMGPNMMGGPAGCGMMGPMMGSGMMRPGMMGGMAMGNVSALGLSPEQRKQVNQLSDDLRKKHWTSMGEIMDDSAQLRDLYSAEKRDPAAIGKVYQKIFDQKRQMIESAIDTQNRIEEILTPEQRDRLKQGRTFPAPQY